MHDGRGAELTAPTATPESGAAPSPAPDSASAPSGASGPSGAAAPNSALDIEVFARNLARVVEEGGKALAAYLKPREEGRIQGEYAEFIDVVKTLGQVGQYWLKDPQRALDLQVNLGRSYLDLWAGAVKRMAGEKTEPVAAPSPKDKRFVDPEWSSNQFFDFLKQAYLLTVSWAARLVNDAEGLDPVTLQKADFYVRQIANALAPSNFVLTNPELLRETLASNAENLARGMHMLAEDIAAGGGDLRIRQTDTHAFEVGRDLAITPGKVVYQNDLIQLIQYAPSTESVLRRPLLIVPPWINKFYVLDLTPDRSFIKWCVDRGLTVFCISWVNPDARLATKTFQDYMLEGPLAALDVIEQVTGETKVNAIRPICVWRQLLRRPRSPIWRRIAINASSPPPSSPARWISPIRATSRSLPTRSRSPRWSAKWPSAASSTAPRWRTPSICCARTTWSGRT